MQSQEACGSSRIVRITPVAQIIPAARITRVTAVARAVLAARVARITPVAAAVLIIPIALATTVAIMALLFAPRVAFAAPEIVFRVGAASRPPSALLWAFWILAGITVAGAVATITRRNPVTAVVCLVATLISSAGLYLLLHASFVAVIQILIYAGAIMVLFVFVLMTVESPEQEEMGFFRGTIFKLLGASAVLWLVVRMLRVLTGPEVRFGSAVPVDFGSTSAIGRVLFSDYLFAFEAISILLLTAIVGAMVVTRRRVGEEASSSPGGRDRMGARARGGSTPTSPSSRRT